MGITTTFHFRWDDDDAPILNGVAGSFYNIIKTCVAGTGVAYGSKQKAGWTLLFDDPSNFTCVIQNSFAHGGSGACIRIQDDASSAGGARVAKWEVFEHMTDIDTGLRPAGWGWVWKARQANSTARGWVIICDERTIYGGTYVGETFPIPLGIANHVAMFMGGDMTPLIPGDPGVVGGAAEQENPTQYTSSVVQSAPMFIVSNSLVPGDRGFKMSRTPYLHPSPVPVGIIPVGIVGSNSITIGSKPAVLPYSVTMIGHEDNFFFYPIQICSKGTIRGRLRGAFAPLTQIRTFRTLGTMFSTYGDLNLTCLTCCNISGSVSTNDDIVGTMAIETMKSWDDV